MKITLEWGIAATESYRADVELEDEHAARLTDLLAQGVELKAALDLIADETDGVFDLEDLAAENETTENQTSADVLERCVQRVRLADEVTTS
ncbi:hypothetical protein K1T35_47510 (plasmid) [Pseudonocardia sp. DSM 110487]|uniref:hypothetical protein n=1 Tax=Pseudonocardia sp. DSM 110487 TaxID=2865833 RepID=UPI001C69816F|nr:hypothetical protein [Pseudonocardia sp. DSM 110487]QYN40998.1 hypothetical protein K1T35_47510 [Pseudonocardia sp. DSM 110487]